MIGEKEPAKEETWINYCGLNSSLKGRLQKPKVNSLKQTYKWPSPVHKSLLFKEDREYLGLAERCAFIEVPAFKNIKDREISNGKWINLAEAEFCVGFFMYLRSKQIPLEEIAIVTTSRG